MSLNISILKDVYESRQRGEYGYFLGSYYDDDDDEKNREIVVLFSLTEEVARVIAHKKFEDLTLIDAEQVLDSCTDLNIYLTHDYPPFQRYFVRLSKFRRVIGIRRLPPNWLIRLGNLGSKTLSIDEYKKLFEEPDRITPPEHL